MISIVIQLILLVINISLICFCLYLTRGLDVLSDELSVLKKAHNKNADTLIYTLESLESVQDSFYEIRDTLEDLTDKDEMTDNRKEVNNELL